MKKFHNFHHRFAMAGAVAFAFAFTLIPCASLAADKPRSHEFTVTTPRVMVIAHRGGAMLRPENTMPAFRHAEELGAEILEFDMMMTADGRIAIYHDAKINPEFCVSDSGLGWVPAPVRGLTYAQIQAFDCGSAARKAYAGERHQPKPGAHIPSLEEVLATFRDSDVMFFAETKIPGASSEVEDVDPVEFASKLNAVVRKYGLEDRLILQSFDFRTIDALHQLNPRIRTCLLGAPKLTDDYLGLLRGHHASCIVLSNDDVDAEGVRQLRKAGMLVYSGVADRKDEWSRYVALGVDAIFTNDPEGLIAFLQKSGLHH